MQKETFKDCRAVSDSKAAFIQAMEEHGYFLAKGRRGHVAVDYKDEKYAVSRYVDIKAKQVRALLGAADYLPSIEQAQSKVKQQIAERLKELQAQQARKAARKRENDDVIEYAFLNGHLFDKKEYTFLKQTKKQAKFVAETS